MSVEDRWEFMSDVDRRRVARAAAPSTDQAGLREAAEATLEAWGVGDMVRDRMPELVAQLAALATPAPLDVERLARALHETICFNPDHDGSDPDDPCIGVNFAAALAARLAAPEDGGEG